VKRGGAIQDGVKASVWKRVVCTLVEIRESIGLPVVHEKKCCNDVALFTASEEGSEEETSK
jgi:hypothetical protein